MAMPIGTPILIESSVATVIMASVRMVSAHMPKYPINTKAARTPNESFQDRLAAKERPINTARTIGQGESSKSFSNQTRKYSSGSKNVSIASP